MAKPKSNTSNKPTNQGGMPWWMDVGTRIVGKVGLTGFAVIYISGFIVTFASIEQKQQLIDTWLLFKGEVNYPAVLINISILILLFIQRYHYKKEGKLQRDRIEELAKEKTLFQNKLLNTELSSSSTKKIVK